MTRNLAAQVDRGEEEGFTLVELLVVIVILGILAAIVVFAVGGITDKGDTSAKAANERSIKIAEEAYYAKSTALSPVYVSESGLVSGGLLRAPSTYHDICLSDVAGPVPVGKSYEVIDAGSSCSTDYTLAP